MSEERGARSRERPARPHYEAVALRGNKGLTHVRALDGERTELKIVVSGGYKTTVGPGLRSTICPLAPTTEYNHLVKTHLVLQNLKTTLVTDDMVIMIAGM